MGRHSHALISDAGLGPAGERGRAWAADSASNPHVDSDAAGYVPDGGALETPSGSPPFARDALAFASNSCLCSLSNQRILGRVPMYSEGLLCAGFLC